MQLLSLRIATTHNVLPHSLLLFGVQVVDVAARIRGEFADVYRGRWRGTEVAVKKIRVYATLPNVVRLQREIVSPIFLIYLFYH